VNNVIIGNRASLGGGIGVSNGNPTVVNNIIWLNSPANGPAIHGLPEPPQQVTYCNISGGWPGEGNIEADPLFTSPDYNLCPQSPCIDAGDPNMQDPDGTRADIGKFYWNHDECGVGTVWHVAATGDDTAGDGSASGPFRHIQHAVDVAARGDTVLVHSGRYKENIDFRSKSIVLSSDYIYSEEDTDVDNTIIDGDFISAAVTFLGCDTTAAIIGFTIINGRAEYGAGINCYCSSPMVRTNIITANACRTWFLLVCTPIHAGFGAGICCRNNSNPEILFNTIYRNSAGTGTPLLGYGGAIYCGDNSNPEIINNTIVGNEGNSGAGIRCAASAPSILNTILWAQNGDEILCDTSSNPSVAFSDIEGGWEGLGNIDMAPLFCDLELSDFRLSESSPCLGTGQDGANMGAWGAGCVPTDVIEEEIGSFLPQGFKLGQNYPNPFNPVTAIEYTVPTRSDVTIRIYNILGQNVSTLVEKSTPAGSYQVLWDGRDCDGDRVASGVYLYRIESGTYSRTRKMVVLK
jgi:hypothetical protein